MHNAVIIPVYPYSSRSCPESGVLTCLALAGHLHPQGLRYRQPKTYLKPSPLTTLTCNVCSIIACFVCSVFEPLFCILSGVRYTIPQVLPLYPTLNFEKFWQDVVVARVRTLSHCAVAYWREVSQERVRAGPNLPAKSYSYDIFWHKPYSPPYVCPHMPRILME